MTEKALDLISEINWAKDHSQIAKMRDASLELADECLDMLCAGGHPDVWVQKTSSLGSDAVGGEHAANTWTTDQAGRVDLRAMARSICLPLSPQP